MWQGNSRENMEGRRGEVVRGKGKELAACWVSLWTRSKRLGIQNLWLVCSDGCHRCGVAIGSVMD